MISNINYNTKEFLISKLDELIKSNILDYYIVIFHKKEKGESKDHFHVFLYPARYIETSGLNEFFYEYNEDNDLPLGFTKLWNLESKGTDLEWILYVLHDKVYLKSKGQERKYHYSPDEFITPDKNVIDDLVFKAYHETVFYHDKAIQELIEKKNYTGADLIKNGYVPIKQACSYHHYLQMLEEG